MDKKRRFHSPDFTAKVAFAAIKPRLGIRKNKRSLWHIYSPYRKIWVLNRNIGQAVENGDIIYVVIFGNFNVFAAKIPTICIVGGEAGIISSFSMP